MLLFLHNFVLVDSWQVWNNGRLENLMGAENKITAVQSARHATTKGTK